jgi:hypothetical protein
MKKSAIRKIVAVTAVIATLSTTVIGVGAETTAEKIARLRAESSASISSILDRLKNVRDTSGSAEETPAEETPEEETPAEETPANSERTLEELLAARDAATHIDPSETMIEFEKTPVTSTIRQKMLDRANALIDSITLQ